MANDVELSLVPIEALYKEIERRSKVFIMAYRMKSPEDNAEMIWSVFGKGQWVEACALANILNNNVLNDWGGELRVLQKLIEEQDEDER